MKKMIIIVLILVAAWLCQNGISHAEMADYTAYPINVNRSVAPNVLFVISNDHTNFFAGYNDLENYDNTREYYGYFNPDACYTYNGSYFEPASLTDDHQCTGQWSGNFLNWLTMCHADFVRKALTGGRRLTDTTDPLLTVLERGSIPKDDHRWEKDPNVDISDYTPYDNNDYTFYNSGITLEVKDGGSTVATFNVRVKVCDPLFGCEDNCNPNTYKPEGVIQRFSDQIRFGLMSYSYKKTDQGGVLRDNVDGNIDQLISFINNFTQKGWDPAAEMYYEGIKYFKGLSPTSDYMPSNDDFAIADWEDPIQYYCQKNFIIIVNDEYPSKDHDGLPGSYWGSVKNPIPGLNVKDWTKSVGDYEGITGTGRYVGRYQDKRKYCNELVTINNLGEVNGICPAEDSAEGSFYIGGLAYYAHITDLRSNDEFEGDQTIDTYAIAFRASPGGYQIPPPPMNQLWLAAKYGGFFDTNGNNIPDLQEEWDKDSDGVPDNFTYAEEGYQFEDSLMKAISDILRKTSSNTAAAILSATGEGEGVVFQAYFEPYDEAAEARWLGYLNALWVDSWGNLREDSNKNENLDLNGDYIIQFVPDDDKGVIIYKYLDGTDGDPDGIRDSCKEPDCYPGKAECDCNADGGNGSLDELIPIWEAGEKLARRTEERNIYTWVDINGDGVVEGNEFIEFNDSNASKLRPFLGAADDTEAENIIRFIRGEDIPGYRNRDVQVGGETLIWKLGDIVNSAPTAVGRPSERMHEYYSDKTYGDFFTAWKDRAINVYVGANDGMLHAFNGGGAGGELGGERWAYIPYNLLPHLKWLTNPDYTHVYYVDLKPRITDARIFNNDGDHPNGWGTILVGGMRFGGGAITLTDDFDGGGPNPVETRTFRSAYCCLDITDPENPQLLWEKSHDNLGFTTSYPGFVRVAGVEDPNVIGEWYAIFGSGPTTYKGTSDQNARFFVLDLKTGAIERDDFISSEPNGFMGPPVTVDYQLNYSDDLIYIGETYDATEGASGKGRMLRISTRGQGVVFDPEDFCYLTDPSSPPGWTMSVLSDQYGDSGTPLPPITSAAMASVDEQNNLWVYFGTGRYFSEVDRVVTSPQYFFGVIDDYWKYDFNDSYNGNVAKTNLSSDSEMSLYEIKTDGTIVKNSVELAKSFKELVADLKIERGWYIELGFGELGFGANPGERLLARPIILGGILFFTTFKPENDICGYIGDSYLYALYYETGTAYTKSIIGKKDGNNVKVINLNKGKASEVGIHMVNRGRGNIGRAIIQKSDLAIDLINITTALKIMSGICAWQQM